MSGYRSLVICLFVFGMVFSAGAITLPSEGAGSDNAFAPTESVTIDLGAAATGPWKTTPGTGAGVYDPTQWAVIFRFTSVTIPQDVIVTFKNNAACAPVIWLVQGDVTLNGQVNLDGAVGVLNGLANTEPGPGGFRGGRCAGDGAAAAAGFGLGGGSLEGDKGGRHVSVYSNEGCFPLIGGSGGAGGSTLSGGAGGGAILVAAAGTINANRSKAIVCCGAGSDWAYGDKVGSGSGGMIRLLAETITGTGTLEASGGTGNDNYSGEPGRIRLEAVNNNFTGGSTPNYSFGVAQATPRLLLDDTTPVITPKTLGGKDIPADPAAKMRYPADAQMDAAGNAQLVIEAKNVPPASTMIVRITRANGPEETATATMRPGGTLELSTWEADINVANGFSALQVRAQFN